MDKKNAFEILKYEGYKNIVLIEKEANYFLDKHSHDFNVDIIIIIGSFEISLSNTNMILFPGSRLKLNKGELHSEKEGSEGVSFLSARPLA